MESFDNLGWENLADLNTWVNTTIPLGWIGAIVALYAAYIGLTIVIVLVGRRIGHEPSEKFINRFGILWIPLWDRHYELKHRFYQWRQNRKNAPALVQLQLRQQQIAHELEVRQAGELLGAFGIRGTEPMWARVNKVQNTLSVQAMACQIGFFLQEVSRHGGAITPELDLANANATIAKEAFRRLFELAKENELVDPNKNNISDYYMPLGSVEELLAARTSLITGSKA